MEASESDGFSQHAPSTSSSTSSLGDYASRYYPGIRGRMSSFFLLTVFFLLLGSCSFCNIKNWLINGQIF